MTQLELPSRKPPTPLAGESEAVLLTLKQFAALGKPWVTGKDLCEFMGWPDCEGSRRKLRNVAEHNRDRLATGDKGYALRASLTFAEAARSWRRRFSMGRKLIEGSIRERASWYKQGETI